jgi:peptide/nickel transport system substrate-binding protein
MAQGQPAVSALQAGTVDLIWSIPPDSIQTLEGAGFDVTSTPSERAYQIALCTTNGLFTSKEARQAITYAVDRDEINEGALAGTGQPTYSPVPPQSPYVDTSLAKKLAPNPKKAKALLKQAGIAPGTTVKALVAAQAPFNTIAEIVQQQLKDAGLDMQITQTTNYVSDVNTMKPDLAIITIEPSRFSQFFSGTVGPVNWCGNKNDAIAAAITAMQDSSKSEQEVDAAYQTFQKLVVDDSPNVPLNMLGLLAAHTDRVKGVEIINSPYGPQLNTVYMVKG